MSRKAIVYTLITLFVFIFPSIFPDEVLFLGMFLIPIWIVVTLDLFVFSTTPKRKKNSIAQLVFRFFPVIYIILCFLATLDNDIGRFIEMWIIGNLLIGPTVGILLVVSIINLFRKKSKPSLENKVTENLDLVHSFSRSREMGMSDEEIRKQAISSGWNNDEVERAIILSKSKT